MKNNAPISFSQVVTNDLHPHALGYYFYKQVLDSLDRVAVKYEGLSISYATLNAKANQFASYLISQNIMVGDILGLSMDKSISMVICFLGTLKAGGAYLPLDPSLPLSRIEYMLRDSRAKVLITSRKYQHLFELKESTLILEDIIAELEDFSDCEPDVEITGNDPAYILYTSGSTGKPKGVLIEHYSLVNLLLSVKDVPGLDRHDVFLSITTMSFDIFQLELHLPLISGAMLILADSDTCKDGRKILDLLKNEGVSVMQATPYTWRMVLDAGWDEYLHLKVLCGGEAMSRILVSDLLPKCSSLWNMYGPTETTIYSTISEIYNSDAVVSIGKPINNTRVYILDELQSPIPTGEVGEIYIGGDGVARGYINLPELTREKFIPDFFTSVPGKTLYRTGDLGKFDADGNIICLGRVDRQIKIRGFRIEAGEVEDNLVQLSPISQATVVGHIDNCNNQRLVAYVVLKNEESKVAFDEHVRSWTRSLRRVLPGYMIPNTFIQLQGLPVSSNGKIDKNALPDPEFDRRSVDFIGPRTATEKMLVDVWSKYLGLNHIGIIDNFFSLGGHSKVAVQIMAELERTIGRVIPISTLFEYPTIEALGKLIDNYDPESTRKSLVPVKAYGTRTPIYIVHGIGLNVMIFHDLASYLDDDQPVYGLQSRGLDGVGNESATIQDIALSYIAEIFNQNPTGPYVIAGYSIGGVIALEMAKQIEQTGREVLRLILIDTNLPVENGFNVKAKLERVMKRQFSKALFVLRSLLANPAETIRYQRLILTAKIKEVALVKYVWNSNKVKVDKVNTMESISELLENAVREYVVSPYNGRTILYKAAKRVYFVDDQKSLGWNKVAVNGLLVREVPGDHRDMLLKPNVVQFAKILQRDLVGNLQA